MSELGEVLALIHGAGESFETVELELRVWTHVERQLEAGLAEMEATERDRARRAMSLHAPPGGVPTENEPLVRIWFERPDRLREECETEWPPGPSYGVRIGPRWWKVDPHFGAIVNEGDENHGSGLGHETRPLLDPSRLLPALRFDRIEPATHLGRAVHRVRARPREVDPNDVPASWALTPLGTGAEEFELDVDAERGVLLRAVALRGDESFSAREIISVAFDEPIDPRRFVFEPPPGQEVRPASALFPKMERLSLHEAAGRARFTVFVPARVPAGWELDVSLLGPDQVLLAYRAPNAAAGLMTIQAPADSDLRPGWPLYGQRGRTVERGGVRYEVIDAAEGPPAQVSFERDGTRVLMSSESLDGDALVHLAASMEPASPDPPAI